MAAKHDEIIKKMNPTILNGIKLVTFENAHEIAQLLIDNDDVAAAALCNELDSQLKHLIKDK